MDKVSLRNYIFAAFFAFISIFMIRNTLVLRKSEVRLNKLTQNVSRLEYEKEILENEVAYRETDAFIEQQARDVLSLVKENEKTYVLGASYDPQGKKVAIDVSPAPVAKSNPQLWLELIF